MSSSAISDILPAGHGVTEIAGGAYRALPNFSLLGVAALLFTCVVLAVSTRYMSSQRSAIDVSTASKPVPVIPYWIPLFAHAFRFLWDPASLFTEGRDLTDHGIFLVQLGPVNMNIVSDPLLVKNVMQQKESVLSFLPIGWAVMEKFFGVPKSRKAAYQAIWTPLTACISKSLMREPELGNILNVVVGLLQDNVANMITFMNSPIDQQPWEKSSGCEMVASSPSTVEVELFSLVRDMMGHASVPALLGKSMLEVCPTILQEIYAMDYGYKWLMTGLPRWFPIPPLTTAHIARKRAKDNITRFFEAYDKALDGEADPVWGDMEDVSTLIKDRNMIYRENNFKPHQREDITILWALTVNANVAVFWQLLHILATPGLLPRILSEIAPYARVGQPSSINGFSEAPELRLSHDGLAKSCPLFKASFYEANRLCSQPWSVRKVEEDATIGVKGSSDVKFNLKKGEYVNIPHDLHMLDPRYYQDPLIFNPDRFLETNEQGEVSVNIGTIRPFGGGPSQCKGRVFAERECLALVAGVLVMYDIEPVGGKWVVPKQRKATAVSLPTMKTMVRIKRKTFVWE